MSFPWRGSQTAASSPAPGTKHCASGTPRLVRARRCSKATGLGSISSVAVLSDGRIVSRDFENTSLIWLFDGKKFQSKSLPRNEFEILSGVSLGQVAPGYSLSGNCVVSESFGRVFVDEPVKWVVKSDDVIAVFQKNGRDHWFQEVSI